MGNEYREIIARLVHHDRGPRISILTEADATGLDLARARIAAKDAFDSAMEALNEHGTTDGLVGDLRDLAHRVQEPHFWSQHRSPGLAVFAAPGLEEIVDLPMVPDPSATVGLVFRVLELCRAAQEPSFLVVTLSSGRVRVFRVHDHAIRPVDVPDVPDSLDSVAQFADIEATLQHHGGSAGPGSTMYHGQEAGVRQMEHLRDRFLRLIDQALLDAPALAPLPVVLAGVDELTAAYRDISKLPHLVPVGVPGNHDRSSPAELLDLVGSTVPDEHLDPVRARDRGEISDHGRRVLTEPRTVFHAAEEGRVEAAFLPMHRNAHGMALDEIAAAVFRNGGRVWVEGPDAPAEQVTALLRF